MGGVKDTSKDKMVLIKISRFPFALLGDSAHRNDERTKTSQLLVTIQRFHALSLRGRGSSLFGTER